MRGRRRNKITLAKAADKTVAKPPRSIRVEATPERFAKAGQDWEPANMDLDSHEIHDTVRMLYPVDALARRGDINGHQSRAAEQIYQDCYDAGYLSIGVVDFSKIRVDYSPVYSVADRKLMAQARASLAMQRLREQHREPIILMVLKGMSVYEYGRMRTGRKAERDCRTAALTFLREALDDLDRVYHGERRGIRGASLVLDYRPAIPSPSDEPG